MLVIGYIYIYIYIYIYNYLNGIGVWSPIMLFTRQNLVESSHFKVAHTFQFWVLNDIADKEHARMRES